MPVKHSMGEFFKQLQEVKDQSQRELLRLRLIIGQQILEEAQDNVKANFGRGRGIKSPITERAYGSSAKRSGRGGGLFGSGQLSAKGEDVIVSFGGLGVPYAAIHEYGGIVTPKRSQFLTIPFQPQFAGRRAREFTLKYGFEPGLGRVLRIPNVDGEAGVAFLLRRRVTIPPRPYLKPAVDKVAKDATIKAMLSRMLGGSAGVTIT